MTALVLTYPGSLSAQQRARIRDVLADWDGTKPIVVEEGAQVSTIGGLTFTVHLARGPLDNLAVTITLPTLDLPPYFEMQGGRYVREVSEDGTQWRTAAGNPVYTWEAT